SARTPSRRPVTVDAVAASHGLSQNDVFQDGPWTFHRRPDRASIRRALDGAPQTGSSILISIRAHSPNVVVPSRFPEWSYVTLRVVRLKRLGHAAALESGGSASETIPL